MPMLLALQVPELDWLHVPSGDTLNEPLGQGAHLAGRQIVHHEIARRGGMKAEMRACRARIEFADFRMDDVVDMNITRTTNRMMK